MKLMKLIPAFLLAAVTVTAADLNQPPKGFKALFNGRDLKGWWGLKTEDPAKWMALDKKALAKKKSGQPQGHSTALVSKGWYPNQ